MERSRPRFPTGTIKNRIGGSACVRVSDVLIVFEIRVTGFGFRVWALGFGFPRFPTGTIKKRIGGSACVRVSNFVFYDFGLVSLYDSD